MNRREIRVFLSSTFNDMHPERDWLVRHTFPKLRRLAAERGVTLTEVDLRWGITEKESREGKTISICMDEILNSKPFFIGLLGNRYGWTPTPEQLGDNAIPERYSWIADDLQQGLSITEIEMQYGVLRNPDDIFASFYIREGGVDDDLRQTSLKDVISNQKKFPVNKYSTPEQLGEFIESRFIEILDSLYPADEFDAASTERFNMHSWADTTSRTYLPDPRTLQVVDGYLSSEPGLLLVTGETGIGKSALLAYITSREAENDDSYVVAHFPAVSPQALSVEVAERFKSEISAVPEGKKLIVVVDDAETITDENDNPDLSWLDVLSKDAYIIVSVEDNKRVLELLSEKATTTLSVHPLLLSQRRSLAEHYFKAYSKTLSEEQLQLISRPSTVTGNTFAYVNMLEEIRCFGSFDSLPEYLDTIFGFSSYQDFYNFIFREKEQFYATPRYPELVKTILSLLYLSADGLTELELSSITGIPPMHISHFVLGNSYLVKRDHDRLILAHPYIDEVVAERYLDEDYVASLRDLIISYFEKPEADPNHVEKELPYQYWLAGEDDQLYDFIGRISYLRNSIEKSDLMSLRYWDTLLQNDPEKYDPAVMIDYAIDPIEQTPILIRFVELLTAHLRQYEALENLASKMVQLVKTDNFEKLLPTWLGILATIYTHTGKYEKALPTFEEAIHATPETDTEHRLILFNNLAEAYLTIAEEQRDPYILDQAIEIQREVLEIRKKSHGLSHHDTAIAMSNLASSLFVAGEEEDEALWLAKKATEILRSLSGEDDIDVALSLEKYGYLQLRMGNHKEALETGKRIEDILINIGGKDNPHIPSALLLQAGALSEMNESDECMLVIFRIFEFLRRNPSAAREKNLLGRLADYAFKAGLYSTVVQIADMIVDYEAFDSRGEKFILNLKAKALANAGRTEEADKVAEEAVNHYLKDEDYLGAVETALSMGSAFSVAGNLEKGAEWFKHGFKLAEQYEVSSSPNTAFAWQNYAVTLYNLQHEEEAVEAMKQACDIRRELFGDDDEMLNEEYIPMYERLYDKANTVTLTEIPTHTLEEVKIFSKFTDNPQYIEDYTEAAEYFARGSISHALNIYTQLYNSISSGGSKETIACVERSLAFCYEMMGDENSTKEAEKLYESSLEKALISQDAQLVEAVAHDYAEFFWNRKDFDEAFRIYTYQLYGSVSHNGLLSLPTLRCLVNMAAASYYMTEPEYDICFDLAMLAAFVAQAGDMEDNLDTISTFIEKTAPILNIDVDEYNPNLAEITANFIDLFTGENLYEGAWAILHFYEHLDAEDGTPYDRFRALLAQSKVYTKDYALAYDKAFEALKFASENADEMEQHGLDMLYAQIAKIYMAHCLYADAEEALSRISEPDDDAERSKAICAFICHNTPFDVSLIDDTDPHYALPILLILQRTGKFSEAQDIFKQLSEMSFSNPYSEISRLYAMVFYLLEAGFEDEAAIYRKIALEKAKSLPATSHELFMQAFSSLQAH